MKRFQIPRNSLAWLLVAQAGVIAPHVWALRLPIWLTLLCVACGLWRVMVYQGRWSYPGRWIKVLFVIGAFIGIGLGYRTFLALDPWVGLLIAAFVLKLLEMHSQRDAYVVILLGYFVAMTEFLYDQSIPHTVYVFLVVAMVTASLIGLNQTRSHLRPATTFRLASVLLLQSLPLMIVLFVLFPRLAPLWTVPLQTTIARTGVSDTMSPGNIAQLTQSDSLAFRATFSGDVPPQSQLYWRGLVLSNFDGETWRQERQGMYGRLMTAGDPVPAWASNIEALGREVNYSIIMEPTNQNWLFSLTVPQVPDIDDIGMVRDFRLFSQRPVRNRLRYELTSHLRYRVDKDLTPTWRYRNTLLPIEGNPRVRALAKRMREEAGSDPEFVNAVLRMFNEQEFVYTLKPPILGDDIVDEFILETRRGFCEHFAGSFVFMMRAAGIPAHVVVGYQGGEYNRIGDYVAVYQFDAHAWAEIWLPDLGWFRVDPTSAVAPERIESGLESALGGEDTFLSDVTLSWLKYRQTLWITEIRLQLSAIGHYWDSWVVGYTPDMQVDLLTRYLGELDRTKIGVIMLTVFFSILAVIGLLVLRKKAIAPLSLVDREYLRFCQLLAKQGLARHLGEGPLDFSRRVATERPDLASAASEVANAYVKQNYVEDDTAEVTELRKAVRAFRVRSLTAN